MRSVTNSATQNETSDHLNRLTDTPRFFTAVSKPSNVALAIDISCVSAIMLPMGGAILHGWLFNKLTDAHGL